jgi:ribosomal protein S18 acetylase RimI-like enzyme
MVMSVLSHRLRLGSRWLRPTGRTAEDIPGDPRDETPAGQEEAPSGDRLRPAIPADLNALGRLGALLMRMHHELDPRRFVPATPGIECEYAAFFGGLLADPDVVILVVEREGEVLGYTYAAIEGSDCMSLRGPAGVLHDLIVDPAHHGGGVGRKLLDATLAALQARGAPRVVLSTAVKNHAAKRLFAEAGFRPTMVEMTRELDDDGRART